MFKTFYENVENLEQLLLEFNTPIPNSKPWSAKKKEILQMWRNLRPDMPILITPIKHQPGQGMESYGEDGIRVSGNWNFISSVLSRFKDLINYENPQTRLRLVFRGVDKTKMTDPAKQSYVFYLNLEDRGKGR